MAVELTRFLTERESYGSKSPLEKAVQAEIQAMAQRIAVQIVAENPDLEAKIESLTREVVTLALREDAALQNAVINAVSRALGDIAAHARQIALEATRQTQGKGEAV